MPQARRISEFEASLVIASSRTARVTQQNLSQKETITTIKIADMVLHTCKPGT